jgi:hydroxymethylpyrimidine pyrophosphatase-like HAD family hydrolase
MKKLLIAFDVDGTLRNNEVTDRVEANERIRTLLIILSSMKNTKIMVWSGGGEVYARQMASAMALDKYVDAYGDKGYGGYDKDGHPIFTTELQPDIAFDDIQACTLGKLNLIVNEKGFTPGYTAPQQQTKKESK